MKRKNLITLLFYSILVVASILTVCLYGTMDSYISNQKNDQFVQRCKDDIVYFLVYQAMELDPDYEPLSFDENIKDVQLIEDINNAFKLQARDYYNFIKKDDSLYYDIKDIKTEKEASNLKENLNQSDYNNFVLNRVNENGNWKVTGTYTDLETIFKDVFTDFIDNNIYDIGQYIEYEEYMPTIEYNGHPYEIYSICSLNVPENLEIHIRIPLDISANSNFFGYAMYYQEQIYFEFFSIIYMIITVLLGLIVFIMPKDDLKEIVPFKWTKHVYFEILFTLLCIILPCAIVMTLYTAAYTASGAVFEIMKQFHIVELSGIVTAVNVLLFFVTYLLISLSWFAFKEFILHPIVYFKERTLTYKLFIWIQNKFYGISRKDFSKEYSIPILLAVFINLICMFVFSSLEGFGIICAIVYSFIIFYFAQKHVKEIQNDYNVILNSANKLKDGNFDQKINQDVHLFNSLKESFNGVYDGFELAVKEEAKSQNMKVELISNVSHDLKTPLTCIKNYVLLLQDENLDEQTRKEYLENLNKYADRLNLLMQDLLQISKINSGNIELELNDLNIIALLNQVLFENEESLLERNLVVKKNFKDEEIILNLDSNKTYRIFENLLVNISKYALSFSRVYIDVFNKEKEVQIVFKNISQDEMNFTPEEIEERFVRGDKSRHGTGSGLGLAIVKSFTEIQGGTFKIEIEGDLFKTIVSFKKQSETV